MASLRPAPLAAACALLFVAWVGGAAGGFLNKTAGAHKAGWLPGGLLGGGGSGDQQKHLNPQMLAYFLRPLASYLAALTAPAAGASNSPSYDDYGSPASFSLPQLPSAPPKLAFLANWLGLGGPAGGALNPSYPRAAPDADPQLPAPATTPATVAAAQEGAAEGGGARAQKEGATR